MSIANKKFKITTKIRALLLKNETLQETVGSKIFPLRADIDTDGDFITYSREQYSVERDKFGIDKQICEVAIVAVSEDYDRSQEIVEAIFDSVEGEHDGDVFQLKDSTEDFANNKYIQVSLYSVD